MTHVLARFGIALSALVLSACGGGGDDPGGTGATGAGATGGTGAGGTGGTGGGSMCGDAIVANDAQNYEFSSTITLPPVSVMPDTELTFQWDGVTKDLLNHDMNPMTDVDNVELGLWELTQTELE